MLERTDSKFMGCQVWLEGEKKRDLTRATKKFDRWVSNAIDSPPIFSFETGDSRGSSKAAATKDSDKKRPQRGSGERVPKTPSVD